MYHFRDLVLVICMLALGCTSTHVLEDPIATMTDRVTLLCFQYDPTTGKYGLVITNLVRMAGGLTAVAIAVACAVMIRRDRRRRAHEGLTAPPAGTAQEF